MKNKLSGLISLDGVAIGISGACIVHCLFLPIIISVLPVFEFWIQKEWIHQFMVILSLPVTGMALMNIMQRRFLISSFMVVGLLLLLVAAFIPALHDHETVLTVSGAMILASGHLLRWHARSF